MLQNFINSALIIDDAEGEIADLKTFLEQKDIWVKHFTPTQLDQMQGPFKNRKLIFLDLQLVDSDTTVNNISRIRKYLRDFIGNDFGAYGVVLWTKHIEELNGVKEKISLDVGNYATPLFIIGLDKTKYLKAGNYNDVLVDLEQELKKNIASIFFIEWNILVDKARDSTISSIFRIEPDYRRQEQNLQFILFQIAKNYTGIPENQMPGHNLTKDTIKGFSDMLHYEVVNHATHSNFLFNNGNEFYFRHDIDPTLYCEYSSSNHLAGKFDEKSIKRNGTLMPKADLRKSPGKENGEANEKKVVDIYAHINSRLLIDSHNLNQAIILPGNIYEIISESPFKLDPLDIPANSINVLIEVTPPCDFSNSKKGKMSRIVAGFICDYTPENLSGIKKGENYYKEIWPVFFNNGNPKLFCFDFRYFGAINEIDLRDAQKYKLISKAKDKLFADILQKLASHTARLGLSVIH